MSYEANTKSKIVSGLINLIVLPVLFFRQQRGAATKPLSTFFHSERPNSRTISHGFRYFNFRFKFSILSSWPHWIVIWFYREWMVSVFLFYDLIYWSLLWIWYDFYYIAQLLICINTDFAEWKEESVSNWSNSLVKCVLFWLHRCSQHTIRAWICVTAQDCTILYYKEALAWY